MSKVQQVIDLALSEVGYKEKATNDQLDDKGANAGSGNFTKYARDLDNVSGFYNGKKNGYAWCDVFVDWLFWKCFGAANAMAMLCQPTQSAGAGCTYSLGYYRIKGRFFDYPQVGDQIFFGSVSASTHTGIVTQFDENYVWTVEGNCADGVNSRRYARSSNYIAGYGRPMWDVEAEPTTVYETTVSVAVKTNECTLNMPILTKGSEGQVVKTLQSLLWNFGYSLEVDGEFGDITLFFVKQFQALKMLEQDGEVGKQTWSKLLGVK